MSNELTDTEKKAKAEAHDALIKHVFDSIRNLFICVGLAAAGGSIIKHHAELQFGSSFNLGIALLVICTAILLFFWNMVHGAGKLIRSAKGARKLLSLPFVALFMVTALTVFQALILTQAEQQRTTAAKQMSSDSSVKNASPQSNSQPLPQRSAP